MRFCLFLDEPKIDLLESTFEKNWMNLQEFSESIRWPEECYICQVRDKCRKCIAGLACNSGGIGKRGKGYCEKITQILKLY